MSKLWKMTSPEVHNSLVTGSKDTEVNEMLEKEFKSLVFKKAHLNPGECTQTVE
jgi:hypothetical protein